MSPRAASSVHIVSLGCARNDVDSEELAARLAAGGFTLVDDPAEAAVVVVNTCGFIAQAKKDSIDTLLEAADLKGHGATQAVVAVGCLAERYGQELADALPEADAVLGFDSYPRIAERLGSVLAGERPASHVPTDRRTLLPIAPIERHRGRTPIPEHQGELPPGVAPASGPRVLRRRLSHEPWAPLKIASGCDRRCAFCAIPRFRGAYLSRRPEEIVTEARWLVDRGVREVLLVSENTSSYGKDLGEPGVLESLLDQLDRVDGLDWIRLSYLQPAEVRPSLIESICTHEHVLPYFDLSFQHASGPLLRRMRRFGDADSFRALIDRIRDLAPQAGIRSNVIVGFPGETEEDVAILNQFLVDAGLDAVGVFGYSDEDGTEAATLPGHLDEDEIAERVSQVAGLADELCTQRAAARVGERMPVLVEAVDRGVAVGRGPHQGPEVDGTVRFEVADASVRPGDLVPVEVTGSDGVDLVAVMRRQP